MKKKNPIESKYLRTLFHGMLFNFVGRNLDPGNQLLRKVHLTDILLIR